MKMKSRSSRDMLLQSTVQTDTSDFEPYIGAVYIHWNGILNEVIKQPNFRGPIQIDLP